MIKKLIKAKFSYQFEDELLEEMVETGQYIEKKKGEAMIRDGEYLRFFPLLITGLIKIMRHDGEGNQLFLYYLTPGETCAMSLTCCMTAQRSMVSALIEEDAEMIVFPIEKLEEWFSKYPSWKGFVMQAYQARFEELINSVDDLAFNRMDERLWSYLVGHHEVLDDHAIEVTHSEIAEDLNTSREVISRLLKNLEKQGKVKLSRNRIEIFQPSS
ncbi:Crp/Fnr family transcriptional regulator [Membranicola marinus]|uniref:Crp/Fnr family transcriptional regulator n=1 Tax=Membranihabitans marinus TaxID=1227546 RepID=A0A953HSA2_9BACT|nr:Crp/Fnr family transcriptional regulator [Membranihabitans marinus]MBY5957445.1 Crp/Fnr family transcriptional regulator [Membranihabitans marinus]